MTTSQDPYDYQPVYSPQKKVNPDHFFFFSALAGWTGWACWAGCAGWAGWAGLAGWAGWAGWAAWVLLGVAWVMVGSIGCRLGLFF